MLSARSAGVVSVVASLGALLTSFLYIPALVGKINQINEQVCLWSFLIPQLRVDSDEFKVIADAAWTELSTTRLISRSRRQVCSTSK